MKNKNKHKSKNTKKDKTEIKNNKTKTKRHKNINFAPPKLIQSPVAKRGACFEVIINALQLFVSVRLSTLVTCVCT